MKHWRVILARLPLPMLALAASYGVYSFAQLFVPLGVAIIQAAAFELTYIGLAVTRDLSKEDRRRATTISVGAVVASIIYNTLAGWFHRQPQLLESASPIAWLMFAILHGAPLAWVAYLVADLLLHSGVQDRKHGQLNQLDRPSGAIDLTDSLLVDPLGDSAEIDQLLTPAADEEAQRRGVVSGSVYFLHADGVGTKIGCATDVAKRTRSIAAFLPFEVQLIHIIPADDMHALETNIHRYFELAGKRLNGEWFRLDPFDIQAIKQVNSASAPSVFPGASARLAPLVLRDIELLDDVDSSLILKDTAKQYSCPHCNQALSSKQSVGAAVKNGYCLACKEVRKAA